MALKSKKLWVAGLTGLLASGLAAQSPAPAQAPVVAQPPAAAPVQRPTYRVQVEGISADVLVKDDRGNFVDDLKPDEFELFEDGVKQKIVSLTVVHGGRVMNVLSAPPPPPPEGIVLPPARRVNDTSGRIFLFFIDDTNLQFRNSPKVRQIFQKISKLLLHDGDMFAVVSSGTSTISVGLTYDRARLDQAAQRIQGDGLGPQELIERSIGGSDGPNELRYRAHVAIKTVEDALDQLEKIHERRKALIWISEGYDYNPYQAARFGLLGKNSEFSQGLGALLDNVNAADRANAGTDPNPEQSSTADDGKPLKPSAINAALMQQETFSDADLFSDMAEVTRAANRANTTIYTIDPRGLVGSPDIDQNVDPREWDEYVKKSQDTIRILAEDTGGVAIVNSNDFDKGIKRIDNESSDYYVLGYVTSNIDPSRRRRKLKVNITRKGVTGITRDEYTVRLTKNPLP